jgi:hypothetical protein
LSAATSEFALPFAADASERNWLKKVASKRVVVLTARRTGKIAFWMLFIAILAIVVAVVIVKTLTITESYRPTSFAYDHCAA